jgi:OmpA-OmpF porin, OOP family
VTDIKKIAGLLAVMFFFSLLLCASDSLSVNGYKPRQIKRMAKGAVKQGDYGTAIYYYEQYLIKEKHGKNIAFSIAECYRNYRDYVKAEEWYLKAFEESNRSNAMALYYVALMQKMNGNYKSASENFLKFKKMSSGKSELKPLIKQFKQELAGCDSAKKMMDTPLKIVVVHMDTSINKIHAEGSPAALSDSTLLFASLRSDKKEYFDPVDTVNFAVRKLYTAKKVNDNWVYKNEFEGPFNQAGVNTSNGAFSPDGKRFYFTRCKKNWEDKMICSIYVSENINGTWNAPSPLNSTVNNPKFTSTQPTVAIESVKKNEVLYFVSDRPKGRGGLDIWYATYDPKKKTYRSAKNAGSKINTAKDEITPFYDADKHMLYFSSDGWPGLGGLDVFKARGELGKYTAAENVGYPVNSSTDDLYYSEGKDKEEGFFVSNRKGGVGLKNPTCCDDLYSFKRLNLVRLSVRGTVNEKQELNSVPLNQVTVSVYLIDPKEKAPVFIKSINSDDKGKYFFDIEPGFDYKLQLSKEGYLSTENALAVKSYIHSQIIEVKQELKPIPKDAIVLKNIYYDTDKSEINPKSLITVDTSLYVLLVNNPDIKVEISSHTDYRGTDKYNQILSQKRAESVVKYLISKGINKDRLVAAGYGESRPIAPNKKPDGTDDAVGMEKNRRTELRIIGSLPHTEVEYEE